MVEALVFHVIGQITAALAGEAFRLLDSQLVSEVSALLEVDSRMSQIRSEFEHIQAFLSDVDLSRYSKTMDAWSKRVREIAHHVEDVIDEYVYLTAKQRSTGCGGFLYNSINKSVNINLWHGITSQLDLIRGDLKHLSEMKERYEIKKDTGVNTGSSSKYANEIRLHIADSSYLMDENEIVGFVDERERLKEWLTDGKQSFSLITVWGRGGVGKTALVSNVYKGQGIKEEFDCHAWVAVSQAFQTVDLLRKIIQEFYSKEEVGLKEIDTLNRRELFKKLRNYLETKRFLLILDDVWDCDVLHDIEDAFVDSANGSKIVVTTREKSVAWLAVEDRVLTVDGLEKNDAWDLFCKKAFWKHKGKCPQELNRWASLIVEKCDGLPLAIVSIARLLSLKATESEWKKFYLQLHVHLNNNPGLDKVRCILNLSYKDLPNYLKNCFLYCSIFPEDYLIKRKRLIRLWTVEGIVQGRGTETPEEVAEEYLNELIHRCMLQVVKRNAFGRVRACRMHDLTRELSISISSSEMFCTICNTSKDKTFLDDRVRRLSVQECSAGFQLGLDMSRLRSFLVFDSASSTSFGLSSVLSSSRYLRVLDLQDAPIESIPDGVTNLFNLHHLGLRGTMVKKLPNSLESLYNLQQLDLMDSRIEELPHSITKLRKLRHLFAEKRINTSSRAYHKQSGVPAPKGLCDLKDLQTLHSIEASISFVKQLSNLSELRSLRIREVRSVHCPTLCASLSKMHFLSHLDVIASNENETLQLEGLNPPPPDLHRLSLKGRLPKALGESPLFHALENKLRRLYLGWSGLEQDPLPCLSRMANLSYLSLQKAYDGQHLIFRRDCFPKLKTLHLKDMDRLVWVKIEKGAMQTLDTLLLADLGALKEIPQGIEFLTSLQNLDLLGMPEEFIEGLLQGRTHSKLHHISSIRYWK